MSSVVLATSIAALALALIAALWVVVRVLLRSIDQPPRVEDRVDPSSALEQLELFTATLRTDVDRLTLAVADGIERVHRAENRIQKTVTSARRAVREAGLEHAGIEAEFEELQPPDDQGIEPLPAMPEGVDETRTVRIPGGHLTIGAA